MTTLTAGQSWSANCLAGNSCMRSIAFNGSFQDTNSSPFYLDDGSDTMYVGDDSSRIHKFTGVFEGTPAEVVGVGSGWPLQVNGTANLSPLRSSIRCRRSIVGDSSGRLSYVRISAASAGSCAAGSPPCVGTPNADVSNGNGRPVVDPPIVDSSTGRFLCSTAVAVVPRTPGW